jgi:hypothetical protein
MGVAAVQSNSETLSGAPMGNEVWILIVEAMAVYFLVLWAHSLRHRFGHVYFYALMGGITAVMSWVTDAGVTVQLGGLTFVIGSTVFYASLLLGVFVVYVFDGPHTTRVAISTIVGVSAMVPVIAAALHMQMNLIGEARIAHVPLPSLRINSASVLATMLVLVFLSITWEYLGKTNLQLKLWLRSFLTLFAFPFLYVYLFWQNRKPGVAIENRPVLAILKKVAEIELTLTCAEEEIERRKKAEAERDQVIQELQKTLSEVKILRGFLPICSVCKKIRDDQGYWNQIESYIRERSEAVFSHSFCPECLAQHYPDHAKDKDDGP